MRRRGARAPRARSRAMMMTFLTAAAAVAAMPHSGHKVQHNASSFTVNDFECMQIDTGDWPSERVHCELQDNVYVWIVEHFDDKHCMQPNKAKPIAQHTSTGCFYFAAYNHSYNDKCNQNRTVTVSAFFGAGCVKPMPVTAVNLKPERFL